MSGSRYPMMLLFLGALVAATPAAAQWTRVPTVTPTDVYSIEVNGDTLLAGADNGVYLSTDAGASWKRSANLPTVGSMVRAALVHDGRIYAGTFGEGVFVSDDLGDSWANYNQGLVGGIGNSAQTIAGMVRSGDSLYVATVGAGAWVRNIRSGTWSLFGSQTLQAFQATNMDFITVGGTRLFATGGFNGTVFYRDPGDPDWTVSLLFNDRFAPGLAGLNAIWTGNRWIVASNIGIYSSDTGAEPWSFVDFGLHSLFFDGLAFDGNDVYSSLGAGGGTLVVRSHDEGVTWEGLDTLASVNTYRLAISRGQLYAGRVDGLWRRSIGSTASLPDVPAAAPMRFAVLGAQPVGDDVRFRIELPEPEAVRLEFFDVAGRHVAESINGSWAAGTHEVRWSARGLEPGVYLARLSAGGRSATARVIRTR